MTVNRSGCWESDTWLTAVFSLDTSSIQSGLNCELYLRGEGKWEVRWGQEMDRPQCWGMERVSLIMLLLEDRKRKTDKKRKQRRWGEGHRMRKWVMIIYSSWTYWKCLEQCDLSRKSIEYSLLDSETRVCLFCVWIIPLRTGPIRAGACVCAGLVTIYGSDHKHTWPGLSVMYKHAISQHVCTPTYSTNVLKQ